MVEGNGPPFVPFLTRNAAAHVGGNHVGQHPMALVDDIVFVRDRRTGARPALNSLVPRLGDVRGQSGKKPGWVEAQLEVVASLRTSDLI